MYRSGFGSDFDNSAVASLLYPKWRAYGSVCDAREEL